METFVAYCKETDSNIRISDLRRLVFEKDLKEDDIHLYCPDCDVPLLAVNLFDKKRIKNRKMYFKEKDGKHIEEAPHSISFDIIDELVVD